MRSVLIVDDHAPFRSAVRTLLERGGFRVVGEAGDGDAALAAVRQAGSRGRPPRRPASRRGRLCDLRADPRRDRCGRERTCRHPDLRPADRHVPATTRAEPGGRIHRQDRPDGTGPPGARHRGVDLLDVMTSSDAGCSQSRARWRGSRWVSAQPRRGTRAWTRVSSPGISPSAGRSSVAGWPPGPPGHRARPAGSSRWSGSRGSPARSGHRSNSSISDRCSTSWRPTRRVGCRPGHGRRRLAAGRGRRGGLCGERDAARRGPRIVAGVAADSSPWVRPASCGLAERCAERG